METYNVIFGLIGLMFMSIIGVYAWTFTVYRDTKESLGKVYKAMNADFVREKVCNTLHESLKEDVAEIKADVKQLLAK